MSSLLAPFWLKLDQPGSPLSPEPLSCIVYQSPFPPLLEGLSFLRQEKDLVPLNGFLFFQASSSVGCIICIWGMMLITKTTEESRRHLESVQSWAWKGCVKPQTDQLRPTQAEPVTNFTK